MLNNMSVFSYREKIYSNMLIFLNKNGKEKIKQKTN